jgi:hypothetical protein
VLCCTVKPQKPNRQSENNLAENNKKKKFNAPETKWCRWMVIRKCGNWIQDDTIGQ